jgi:eukaryotic-like serine/threonine-protein kinase
MDTRMACQQCGVMVTAGARFCANCGADVSAEQGNVATRRFTSTQAMHDRLLERVRRAALGEYEILTELGRGGMATVYLAHDIQLDRKVALKVMLPAMLEGEDMVERFRLEARTAAQLSHPHIIPIYAVRTAEQLVYFVMKFVEGRPLDAIIKEVGQLPVPMVRSILSKVGEALGYAHRRGVVHRDIKPANLMIDVEGLPVVTDFGIAKVADTRGLTMTGAMMGTPTYMSPEQCSAREITGASDQYSLGVVAYQMLGGRVPFEGDTVVSLLYKHVHEPPPPLLAARPDCPPALATAVMRMLAKDPGDRFPSMEAAVEAIGSVTLAFDDPVRTQLIGLARRGENVSALKRISTPQSPIPRRTKPMDVVADGTPAPAALHGSSASHAPARGRAVGRYAVAGALALLLGGTAWLRPWERAADAAGSAEPDGGIARVGAASSPASAEQPPADQDGGAGDARPAGDGSAGERESAPPVPQPRTTTAAVDVARVRIAAPPSSVTVGGTAALRAVAVDARGGTLADRPIRWTSADAARATVTPEGLVTALSPGTVTLTARAGAASQSLTLEILPVRAASVSLSPAPAALVVGSSSRLTATPLDAAGRSVASAVSWRTADPRVATVADGVVTGVGAGSTVITASADGRESSVTVQVSAPAAAAPPPDPRTPAVSAEPAPVAPREAIDAAIQRYARALESKQLPEVRAAYPGLTPEQEAQFTRTLRTLDQLRVTLQVGSLNIVGTEATAAVTGEYQFYSPENRRNERLPVRFTATLDRGPSGWQIRSIR